MEAVNWAVKYRPKTLDQIVGNQTAKATVRGFAAKNQWPGVMLITGPTSAGKTTLAAIIGKIINDLKPNEFNPDFVEINIGDQKGIEDMRELVKTLPFLPQLRKKIIVLEEAHLITKQGASLLLRPLENPPKHCVFILCTNEPEKILGTLTGRCLSIDMSYPTNEEIIELLARVAKKENWQNMPKLFGRIATLTGNQPRLSLSVLQKVVSATQGGAEIKAALVQALASTDGGQINSNQLIAAVLKGDPIGVVNVLNSGGSIMAIMTFAIEGLIYLIQNEAGIKPPVVTYFNHQLRKLLEGTPKGIGTLSAVLTAFNAVRRDMKAFELPEKPASFEHLLGVTLRIKKLRSNK